jgi:hypothetical protein
MFVLEFLLTFRTFVNGRSGPEMMEDMRERIKTSDLGTEKLQGIQVRFVFSFRSNNFRQCVTLLLTE